jgi:Fic family protein
MNIQEYIIEEVERQGHNTGHPEGVWRVIWMMNAWREAQVRDLNDEFWLQFVEELGRMIEPHKNHTGLRRCDVFVGGSKKPNPNELKSLLARWWEKLDNMTPLEAYKEFEEIHPFVDGNGRAGKIVLNWRNGTLHNPIFPPNDLWGRVIANP